MFRFRFRRRRRKIVAVCGVHGEPGMVAVLLSGETYYRYMSEAAYYELKRSLGDT